MLNTTKPINKKNQSYSEIDGFSFWNCGVSVMFVLSFIIHEWSIFFLIVGTVNLAFSVYYIRRSMLTKSWQKVRGEYSLFRLDKVTIQRCRRGGVDVRYRPYCVYSYILDDVPYSSDRLSIVKKDYELNSVADNELKHIIKRDIATKSIDVFVNTANPKDTVLVREISKWKILSIYFIGLLSVVQIAVAVFWLIYGVNR